MCDREKDRQAQTLLSQLDEWNEQNEYQRIIDAIESLRESEQTPELISLLARAYNNAAQYGEHSKYLKAVELLKSVEAECSGEHTWNFRMAYAYYYLDREAAALHYFEKALEYRPGDEDTLEFIQQCRRGLTQPTSIKPFEARTADGWASFAAGEAELRAKIDRKELGEDIVRLCTELLAPAFRDVAFELGHNGEKYELILTPDGDKAELFKLVYFCDHAPEELKLRWNFLVGRRGMGTDMQMFGYSLTDTDIQVWVERLEHRSLGLSIYCEKLLPLQKSNESQAYYFISVMLDQLLGEIAAMQYIGYMDLLEVPGEGESVLMSDLRSIIQTQEGADGDISAQKYCETYTAYERKTGDGNDEDWEPRDDIFVGCTTCPPVINAYYQDDDAVMERFHADGAVPGFFFYDLEGVPRDQILDLRDSIEAAITKAAGGDAVRFIGGATGHWNGYLDFIAWNLRKVLNASVDVFATTTVKSASFHTFRRGVNSVWIKRPKDTE